MWPFVRVSGIKPQFGENEKMFVLTKCCQISCFFKSDKNHVSCLKTGVWGGPDVTKKPLDDTVKHEACYRTPVLHMSDVRKHAVMHCACNALQHASSHPTCEGQAFPYHASCSTVVPSLKLSLLTVAQAFSSDNTLQDAKPQSGSDFLAQGLARCGSRLG